MKVKYLIILGLTLVLGLHTTTFGQVQRITIGVGTHGGVWYMMGAGMSKIINEYVTNVNCVPVTPAGITENPKLISSGEFTIGLATNDTVYFAMRGEREYKQKYPNITSMLALSRAVMGITLLADSPINSISDIKGKRMGCPSASSLEMLQDLFRIHGIDPKDINFRILSYKDQVDALKDGHIDVAYLATNPKNTLIEELTLRKGVKFISMAPDRQAEWNRTYPYWAAGDAPAGMYKGQKDAVWGPAWYGALCAHKQADEKLIYNIEKVIFEHHDELAKIHPALKEVSFEQTKKYVEEGLFIAPFHPGAVKYLKEKGIQIPKKFLTE
jgi:TRAP transporter TAXI family solute receptor